VALDRSAFYPEGGGQPADRGELNGLPVVDVQADGALVWHLLGQASGALEVGTGVTGQIEWTRRQDHMQQHCGQHLLTAACVAVGGPQTVAFHLGEREVTIDLEREPTESELRAAEALANQVIWEDRPVAARFVNAKELAGIALRKPPSVTGPVRVVSVADFDHAACGGTHPRSTGGVGVTAVLGSSRLRGGARVRFVCGRRALRELHRLGAAANAAAGALSVGVDELSAAAERAVVTQKELAKALAEAQRELDEALGARLYAEGERAGEVRIVRAELPGLTPERLRVVAQLIAAQPGGVAILGSGGARASLVAACGRATGRDAQALLRVGLVAVGGRGGGNAQLAQGGGPEAVGLQEALELMRAAARDR
jgi:alanyl-tRNA synthetase